MRYVKLATVKTKPEYWSLIVKGEKTIEVSDDDMPDCQGMIFVHPTTGDILGAARIKTRTTLIDWTPALVAKLASISEQDAFGRFVGDMDQLRQMAAWDGWRPSDDPDPLYAFEIEPCGIEQLIRNETKDNK